MKKNLFLTLTFFVCSVAGGFAQSNTKAAETYNKALEVQAAGDVNGALALYESAIKLNPQMADAYNNRANIRLSLNDLDGAIADYTKVVELNPKYALCRFNRGNIYMQKGETDAAIADFSKAIEIFNVFTVGMVVDKDKIYDRAAHVMAYNNRGNAYQTKTEYKSALADYDKALELAPTSFEALVNRGVVKQELKDIKGAIADYTKALELNPKNATVYLNRGTALEEVSKTAALADYNKTIELDDTQAQAFARRGLLLLGEGKKAEAARDLEKAFALDAGLLEYYGMFLKEAKKR